MRVGVASGRTKRAAYGTTSEETNHKRAELAKAGTPLAGMEPLEAGEEHTGKNQGLLYRMWPANAPDGKLSRGKHRDDVHDPAEGNRSPHEAYQHNRDQVWRRIALNPDH